MSVPGAPSIDDVQAARVRLDGVARVTPLYASESISRLAGRPVSLKAENLQRTGAFKIRGAYNTVAQLSERERAAGVVTASAGNHGQAVAWAAREGGIPATIVVPEGAPMAKVEAARAYGARVELAGEDYDESLAAARAVERETGATFVHAFEDARVIAGQGTLGLELADQLPEGPGTVVVPVGGGGLVSGIAIALAALRPELRRRRRPGGRLRAARGSYADRRDDRRRDRRQAAGDAHGRDRRGARGRARRRRRRGDLPGARAPPRAREARRRGSGRGPGGGARRGPDPPGPAPPARCSRAATSTRRRSTPSSATG